MVADIFEKKILAFDTSWDFGVVGTVVRLEIVDKIYGRSPRAASEGLLPWIMEVTSRSGWNQRDIEIIAVGRGPGSFTGTRIALSVTKGLAEILNVPVVSVSSVESIVLTVGTTGQPVAVLMDARKGEVMAGVYEIVDEEKRIGGRADRLAGVRTLDGPVLIKPETVREKLVFYSKELSCLRVCGNAFKTYPDLLESVKSKIKIDGYFDDLMIDPLAIAKLAVLRLLKGQEDDASTLEPIYLRDR